VLVACSSVASHAETACERHNWTTSSGNFGVVELSMSGSMRDAWTLVITPWFRWELPVPLCPLLAVCLLVLASLAWVCHAIVCRYQKKWGHHQKNGGQSKILNADVGRNPEF
jgi:hypothetical protein